MIELLKKSIHDDKGNVSHARIIALTVAISATIFMWKLTVMGQLTTEYFLYYLIYGTIHQSLNKALDVIGAWFGIRFNKGGQDVRPTSDSGGGSSTTKAGSGRGGHGASGGQVIRGADDGAAVKTPEGDA